jgi:hypothetical protein
MTFAELKAEVFRRLEENPDTPAFWTEVDVAEALNDGYEELSDASEFYERNAILNLLSNRTYYDLRCVLGDTQVLSFRTAFNSTTRRWMSPTDPRTLDTRVFQQWENITGEPEAIFTRGLWWLGVYPQAATDTGNMKVYFSSIPPALVNEDDKPGFPEEYHEALIEYAVGDLLSQDGETNKALRHFEEYMKLQGAMMKAVDGRISLDRINTLRG